MASYDDEDTGMPEVHRELLNANLDNLTQNMNPELVVAQLIKRGVFDSDDKARVLHPITPSEKNIELIDLLKGRGNKFFLFIASLRAIDHRHNVLADSLVSIKQRVLWFVFSPTMAAAVVSVLNKYHHTRLNHVKGRKDGRKYLVRRGYFDESGGIELCLVFPIDSRPETVSEAMTQAFTEVCPSADAAVMSGGCEGVSGDGEAVVITPGTHNSDVIAKVKDALISQFSVGNAPWISDVSALLQTQSSLHYEACWLTRLHVEIEKFKTGYVDARWLVEVGWDVANVDTLNDCNSSVLSHKLHHWSDGSLTAYLLQGAWHVHPSSILGMLPTENTRQYVDSRMAVNPDFPGPYVQQSVAVPRFSSDVSRDSESKQFYELCVQCLPSKPVLVCKTGLYRLASQHSHEAISSSCIIMEALATLLSL